MMAIEAVARVAYRALLAAGGVGLLVTVVTAFATPHPADSGMVDGWGWAAAVALLYFVGLLAVVARPDHLSARWLGAAGSLLGIYAAVINLLPQLPDLRGGWSVAVALSVHTGILATNAAMASVLVVFPDDRYRYQYQRRVLCAIWSFVVIIPLMLLASQPALYVPPIWSGPELSSPMFVSALAPLSGVAEAAYKGWAVLWAVGVTAMLIRYRRASSADRQRFRWPLAFAIMLLPLLAGYQVLEHLGRMPSESVVARLVFSGLLAGMILLAASILVALVRHRLIGIDLWLRRTVLFGGASAVIALAYLGLAGSAGWAAGQGVSVGVGVTVTLAAVVAFYPVRRRLDAWARRWVFGSSVAETDVLRRVGETLEDAHDVGQLGDSLVRTVVSSLGLEWARMSLSVDGSGTSEPVAMHGVDQDESVVPDLVVPLTDRDETVGFLECGPKREGELTKADEALLTMVGQQAALAVRSVRLASELESRLDELAASRSRLVHAQMAERHRIERNIHDGVQQEIIASLAKVRLARNQLTRDPVVAETTLAGLQDDTGRMLDNLRELSRGIHPSVLTHQGLVEALRTQAALLPINVHVDVTTDVRDARFPEEVEEAAYYVVSEGLTNVLKHAHTDQATVTLAIDNGQLAVEVIDHGRGSVTGSEPGSGIVGLRDRLGSIGGELRIDDRPGDGTTLRANLPTQVAERRG